MIGQSTLFSRATDEWGTPLMFFNQLNDEFGFTLDPCATPENRKCEKFFTKEEDGLTKDWAGEKVFVNPPYSDIKRWVEKCYQESDKPNTKVVMLIPSRTDTRWFHDFIYKKSEVRFVKGRLKFGSAKFNAPFPSMVVVF